MHKVVGETHTLSSRYIKPILTSEESKILEMVDHFPIEESIEESKILDL